MQNEIPEHTVEDEVSYPWAVFSVLLPDPCYLMFDLAPMGSNNFPDYEIIYRLIHPGSSRVFNCSQFLVMNLIMLINEMSVKYFGVYEHSECLVLPFPPVDELVGSLLLY